VIEAIAATIGTRSPTALMHVFHNSIFSSIVSVPPSPRLPFVTIPVQPLSTSHETCLVTKAWSISKFSSKQVVIAGITPVQSMFIGFLILQEKLADARNQASSRVRIPSPAHKLALDTR